MPDLLKRRSVQLLLVAVLCGAAFLVWRSSFSEAPKPDFSGERALAQVRRQTGFGPRAPGSEGHRKAKAYFVETLRQYADRVRVQSFTYPGEGDSAQAQAGANIIAAFKPEAERRVLLAAHYDTRPVADEDADSTKRRLPVLGANDGASGVAVLLEVARLLHAEPPDVGVDLVLFDLEDLGKTAAVPDSSGRQIPFAIGARHFATHLDGPRPDFGILLDMVCDRNLRIPKEGHSLRGAPAVVEKVWDAAEDVEASAFVDRPGPSITDDHVPLLEQGIPMVDLIPAPFPWYWHTTMDRPTWCSAESLGQVGAVVVEVVYDE